MIKPQKLSKGDTIAIISPSSGVPSLFPHIFDEGLRILREEFGLNIKEYPTARMGIDELYNNPKKRAEDINQAFKDKEVKGIISSIGGEDSVRILEYLDEETIKQNPKIIMGFSDTTPILNYINQLGIVTFNGPAIMAGFAEMNEFPEYIEHVKKILFETNESFEYSEYKEWSNEYLDWGKKENTGKVGKKNENKGWKWLQGEESVQGELFGGCIDVFTMINGTRFWPDSEFWKGKILFLETSEEKPSPDFVGHVLRNLGVQGILNKIKGILVGRAKDYTEEETKELEEKIINVVNKEFNRSDIPIVTKMDFGHTDPQIILPLGTKAEIDPKNKKFKLLESPLKE